MLLIVSPVDDIYFVGTALAPNPGELDAAIFSAPRAAAVCTAMPSCSPP